jgi:hypothetical protein
MARRAWDGSCYTRQQFAEHYGGLREWEAAGATVYEERRRATDGCLGTIQQFKEKFGGTAEWGNAPAELREDPNDSTSGKVYTKQDFTEHYGGTSEWDAAPPTETRIAPDGKAYSRKGFIDNFGGTVEWESAQGRVAPNGKVYNEHTWPLPSGVFGATMGWGMAKSAKKQKRDNDEGGHWCTGCGTWKPFSGFSGAQRRRGGATRKCFECLPQGAIDAGKAK